MVNQKISFVQFLFVKIFFDLKILLERVPFFRFKNTFGESFVEHKPIYQK